MKKPLSVRVREGTNGQKKDATWVCLREGCYPTAVSESSVPTADDAGDVVKWKTYNYRKYRLRRCLTLHWCNLCKTYVLLGEEYFDGGYGRRAHRVCVEKSEGTMAKKARVSVNEAEQDLVVRTRKLTKLQARRRQKVDELAALDAEIAAVNRELHAKLPPVAPVEPPQSGEGSARAGRYDAPFVNPSK